MHNIHWVTKAEKRESHKESDSLSPQPAGLCESNFRDDSCNMSQRPCSGGRHDGRPPRPHSGPRSDAHMDRQVTQQLSGPGDTALFTASSWQRQRIRSRRWLRTLPCSGCCPTENGRKGVRTVAPSSNFISIWVSKTCKLSFDLEPPHSILFHPTPSPPSAQIPGS